MECCGSSRRERWRRGTTTWSASRTRTVTGQSEHFLHQNAIEIFKQSKSEERVQMKLDTDCRHVSSSEPPSLTSVEDGSEFRDLRKAKRDLDLRLLDREDQVRATLHAGAVLY